MCISSNTNLFNLRKSLRQQRRNLSAKQQSLAAFKVALITSRHPWFKQAQRIGFYWPSDGELNPIPLLRRARKLGKRCYLPLVQTDKTLKFAPYTLQSTLRLNRFKIPEPICTKAQMRDISDLDLVFLPLVAFDRQGNRLGMGGGFYDRTFRNRSAKKRKIKAKRIGLAHSIQEIAQLQSEPWDVPLLACATELGLDTYRLF